MHLFYCCAIINEFNYVKIENNCNNTIMSIVNNGRKPTEAIIEHDGIKGMRRKVKKINGELFINTSNVFEIRVTL